MNMGNSHSINIGVKLLVVWLMILAGTIEAILGLLQVYGYEPSNHSLYALTGSFYNPGPYSGFLAMCLPLALNEWLEGKKIWKHVALVALVLMAWAPMAAAILSAPISFGLEYFRCNPVLMPGLMRSGSLSKYLMQALVRG